MSDKKIVNTSEALESLQKGVNILADTVGSTLGPKGRNVVIRKSHYNTVTKDGVTVAMQVFLDDKFENAGAQMVKEVALKTNQVAGDGTTTATVLAQAIVNAGRKNIVAGANPMGIKRGIDAAVLKVVEYLKEISISVDDDYEKIEQIGTISSNNDASIGKLIADTMRQIGKNGVIYIEESRLAANKVEFIEGVQVNQGYISPYFVTEPSRGTCVLEDPLILVYDGKLTGIGPMLELLDAVTRQNKSLLIIADDVDGETLSSLIYNKNNGKLKCCAIKSPFGDNSKDVLKDICVNTGATFITEDQGLKLEYATLDHLGTASKIIIGETITTIVGGAGLEEDIDDHILDLKGLMSKSAEASYEYVQYADRIAKLCQGVAVIYVGGLTEVEMKEKKDRVEDALNATKAAVQEGIVPGGGVAYIRAITSLIPLNFEMSDEQIGVRIVIEALKAPLYKICENGALKGDVIVQQVMESDVNDGFNALTEEYEDLLESGVIDPTKVARVALENAASVATLILTTSAIIVD